jgi:hypothetical protein
MSTTLDRFRLYYPEFAGVSDADVSIIIEDVSAEFIPTVWGAFYLRGLLALSAHIMALRAQSARAGVAGGAGSGLAPVGGVSSLSTGDQSISYGGAGIAAGSAQSGLSEAILATTPYGQEYLRLRGRLFVGMRVL